MEGEGRKDGGKGGGGRDMKLWWIGTWSDLRDALTTCCIPHKIQTWITVGHIL